MCGVRWLIWFLFHSHCIGCKRLSTIYQFMRSNIRNHNLLRAFSVDNSGVGANIVATECYIFFIRSSHFCVFFCSLKTPLSVHFVAKHVHYSLLFNQMSANSIEANFSSINSYVRKDTHSLSE